jgi:hypothetical protein
MYFLVELDPKDRRLEEFTRHRSEQAGLEAYERRKQELAEKDGMSELAIAKRLELWDTETWTAYCSLHIEMLTERHLR